MFRNALLNKKKEIDKRLIILSLSDIQVVRNKLPKNRIRPESSPELNNKKTLKEKLAKFKSDIASLWLKLFTCTCYVFIYGHRLILQNIG